MPKKTLYQAELDSQLSYHASVMEGLAARKDLFTAIDPLRDAYPTWTFSSSVTYAPFVTVYAFGLSSPRDTVAIRRDLAKLGFHLDGEVVKREDGWTWNLVHPELGAIKIYGTLSIGSTACRRVLVRTETREVPVYEIECDIKE